MKNFEFLQPLSAADAVAAWTPDAAYLGGGTNLVDLMKTGAMGPDRVIDITRLPDLDRIETTEDGGLRIGALVRNSDLARDPDLLRAAPMVAEALLAGASGQLRNAATVGGNLMQHTRCPYFMDADAACNRRVPGSGCDARGGAWENSAILGQSAACIATNPSDFCVPLAALGALVDVEGPSGGRTVALEAFHKLPGDTPEAETALEPGELVVALRLPAEAASFAGHSRYLKVRERTSYAFALVSAAAALRMDGGRITEGRLALGSVAARPWRIAEADALLAGAMPDDALFARVAERLLEGAEPSNDTGWKIDLARRTVIRALQMAAAGTPDRLPPLPASPFGPSEVAVHA
ncbi:xanthine dehydrogenase YagS FAD-binding subunit [Palleronia aestuarii]|uniref:Xanthine dehydrogenase YagS FAD-binding subunit n=1 Tax=Palleronia aestuarii TaxID=568105 RepID=A0A2W7NBG5_9RHOB|nr:xanthine dehydrogenase family protein subunit M [Palleronia aestuarii]PZX17765.1 xanthine dehydrogenase YagS FAD-binding subunit [Palleronia aestuarii]